MFTTDSKLLESAAAKLSRRSDIYWITGGACSGKSTVCSEIALRTGVHVIDMDKYIYGSWIGRYSPDRHPASTAWFGGTGGLGWVMSLSPEDFDSLNRAACAEHLDLLSEYLTGDAAEGSAIHRCWPGSFLRKGYSVLRLMTVSAGITGRLILKGLS